MNKALAKSFSFWFENWVSGRVYFFQEDMTIAKGKYLEFLVSCYQYWWWLKLKGKIFDSGFRKMSIIM